MTDKDTNPVPSENSLPSPSSPSSTYLSSSSSSKEASTGQPIIVEGQEYHTYDSSRYVFVGKDESGEPEFLDYGPQSER